MQFLTAFFTPLRYEDEIRLCSGMEYTFTELKKVSGESSSSSGGLCTRAGRGSTAQAQPWPADEVLGRRGGQRGHRLQRKSTSESGPLWAPKSPGAPGRSSRGSQRWAERVVHPGHLCSMSSNDTRRWERLQADKRVCFCFLSLGYTLFKHPAPEGAAFEYQLKWEALT